MKPQSTALIVAAALSFASVTAAISTPLALRATIQAACDAQNRAAENKDIAAFMNTLAPDFSARDNDGQPISRTQARQNMLQLFDAATHISGQTTIQTFTVKAGKAYITTKEHDVIVSTDPQTQQSASAIDDQIDAEVWCKVGAAWKEQSERVVSESDFYTARNGTRRRTRPNNVNETKARGIVLLIAAAIEILDLLWFLHIALKSGRSLLPYPDSIFGIETYLIVVIAATGLLGAGFLVGAVWNIASSRMRKPAETGIAQEQVWPPPPTSPPQS